MKLEWSESFKQDLPVDYIHFLRDNPRGVLLKNSSRWDKRTWNLLGKVALLK
ncbi:MAG: hypothetical protein ABJO28_10455 [Maribacter dokdonensis]|uniref:hypothetical protein n=1 Tax=Maribacter dokdonensis TaxID=320912 RepID=UPI003266CA4D